MLQLAIICLVVALIAAVLGFGGIAGSFVGVAKILFCRLPRHCGVVLLFRRRAAENLTRERTEARLHKSLQAASRWWRDLNYQFLD